jgi:hypothetical protein
VSGWNPVVDGGRPPIYSTRRSLATLCLRGARLLYWNRLIKIGMLATLLAFSSAQCLMAGDDSWNKIRFIGGTIQVKGVDPYDWNTTLTVRSGGIVMAIGHRQTVRILPAKVTTMSYGQEAHRRVAEMVAVSLLVTPVALFGLLHKGKDHFIGIEYRGDDGKTGSVLLEADKNNYRAVLEALKAVTGKPVENAP